MDQSVPSLPPSLPEWRRRILDRTLLVAALLGPLGYVPSAWLSAREHLWGLVILDTLIYGWVVVLALRPHWPYQLRAGSLVGLVLVLAVVLGPMTGLRETALVWLEFVSIVAALFLSRRGAYGVFGVSFLILVGLSLFMNRGLAPMGSSLWLAWVVTGCNAVLLGGIVALTLTVLLRGLEETNQNLLREVEERRRAEAERRQLEAELRRSQSLEIVGTLASGIIHDLKNILQPVMMLTGLVQEGLDKGSPAHRQLNDVLAAAERGRELTQRILTFVRPRTASRQPVAVAKVVDEVSRLLQPTLPLQVQIRVHLEPPQARVEADPIELHQVLLNLGTNAAHAMREQGRGEILLRLQWQRKDQVSIQVLDSGVGMDPDTLARAFDPFFSTKPDLEGTGLGLAMSRRIVEGLGGTLTLSSSPGMGTCAQILLPATQD